MKGAPRGALREAQQAWQCSDLERAAAHLEPGGHDEELTIAVAIERICGAVEETLSDAAYCGFHGPTAPIGLVRARKLRQAVQPLLRSAGVPAAASAQADAHARAMSHEALCLRLPVIPHAIGSLHGRGWQPVLLERDSERGDLWWVFGPLRKQAAARVPRGAGPVARRIAWLALRSLFPLSLRRRLRAWSRGERYP